MTEIVLAHDQKLVHGHYFSVGPNALPKCTPDFTTFSSLLEDTVAPFLFTNMLFRIFKIF